MHSREELVRVAYKSVQDRFDVDYQTFAQSICEWDIHPVEVAGELVGGVLTRGAEIHVGVIPEGRRRWLSRALIRKTLGRILEKYGEAKTTVMRTNTAGHAFVTRLGFLKIGEDADVIYYICKDMSNG